uniref:Uncharacterized protein n=1 Tax=Glossina brevipalpis TaxID=37001 RepID=A0A1A9X0A9_9MUSC
MHNKQHKYAAAAEHNICVSVCIMLGIALESDPIYILDQRKILQLEQMSNYSPRPLLYNSNIDDFKFVASVGLKLNIKKDHLYCIMFAAKYLWFKDINVPCVTKGKNSYTIPSRKCGSRHSTQNYKAIAKFNVLLKLFVVAVSHHKCLLTKVIRDFLTTVNLSGAQSKSVSKASFSQRIPTSSYSEYLDLNTHLYCQFLQILVWVDSSTTVHIHHIAGEMLYSAWGIILSDLFPSD